jgi:gliding motility-associated-like protein
MIRQLLIFLAFAATPSLYAQTVEDDCANATVGFAYSNGSAFTVAPGTLMDDGVYLGSLASGVNGYIAITVPADGLYDISFDASVGAASGNISVAFAADCASLSELGSGDVGTVIDASCIYLTTGTAVVALAFDGTPGDVEITITSPSATSASNDDCADALGIVPGNNTGLDNICAVDGTVWYEYTVLNGGDLDFTVTPGTIGSASIQQALLNTCTGIDIFNQWDCLGPGDIIYLEVGNITPAYGDFSIDVTDNLSPDANDICANATALTLGCGGSLSLVGGGCYDADVEATAPAGCLPMDLAAAGFVPENASGGLWYRVDLDPEVSTVDLTASVGDYAVYSTAGGCGSLAIIDCDPTALNPAIDLTTSYFIVAFDGATVDLQVISAPGNDLCGAATGLTIGGPAIDGTLTCAAQDFTGTSCDEDAQVFYTFTTNATDKTDITITLAEDNSNGTAASEASFVVLEDCGGAPYNDPNATQCDVLASGSMDLTCVEPNTTLIVMVQSSTADAGDFTIAITENTTPASAPLNDLCADAIDASSGTASGSTECANSEDPYCGGTATDNDYQTVYYDYTITSTSANLSIAVVGSGSPALSAGSIAFYDACATDLGDEYGAPGAAFTGFTCDHTTGLDLFCVPAGTYTIAVGSSLVGEGSFDLTITETDASVVNDLCGDASPIANGGLTNQTNLCAGGEEAFCGLDGSTSHDVYYSFDPLGTPVDITINVGGGGTVAPQIGDVNVLVLDGCGGTTIDPSNVLDGCSSDDGDLEYTCITDPIIIVVASADGSEGNFDIQFTTSSAVPANDDCTSPTLLTDGNVEATDNLCSGPDHNLCGGGATDSDASTVYFNYSTGASNADVTINVAGGATPISDVSLVVFEDDCTTVYGDPDAQNCTYTLGIDVILECVPANTEILIAVGSSEIGQGDFDILVSEVAAAPINDICATDAEVLADGVAFDGTTACASPDAVGFCGLNTTDDGVVYHEYTVVGPGNVQLTISLVGNTTTTGTAITDGVLYISDAGCNGVDYTTSNPPMSGDPCMATNGDVIFNCVEPGTVLTIAVGATAANAGDYGISVAEDNSVVSPDGNDLCGDAIAINFAADCEFETVTFDNTDACPESFTGSSCDFDTEAVVWYTVTLPADGTGIEVANLGTDVFLGIFEDDCSNLALAGTPADCATGDELFEGLTGGNTYLVAVGIDGATGSESFDIKTIVPPANDICDPDAESLTSNTATPGTTICATGPVTGTACDPDKTNTVWYTYTVEPDVKEITIDVTGYTTVGADQLSVAVVDDCASLTLLNQADGTPADYCGGSGTDLITLSCVEEGTTITILVASSAANEGSFDITLNTTTATPGCVDNDECADVDQTAFATAIVTDDPEICITDCNELACPDDEVDILCGAPIFNTVFYEFTTDNFDPLIPTFVQANVTGLTDPVVAIVEGTCPNYTLLPGSTCANGDTGPLDGNMTLAPNTTYTVIVGTNDNMGGTFDLCIRVFSGCVNDDCADAVEVTGLATGTGTTVTNPASTVGCMPDVGCGSNDDATVWYRFTMPDDATSFTVDIVGVGTDPVGGTSIQVGLYNNGADCPTPTPEQQDCNATTLTLDCALPGAEYYVIIGSNDMMDEGEFEITITPNPPAEANDLCTGAEVLVVDMFCDFMEFNLTTVNRCPELGMADGCDYSLSAVSWYEFTTPADFMSDVSMEITGALANPFFGVFTSCGPPLTFIGGFGCNTMLTDGIPLMSNTTYYIAVGSTTADTEGTFTLRIKIDVPPINDSPDPNHPNVPALDLNGTGGTHGGTTCCAVGAIDDPAADLPNQDCPGAFDENSVWYTFTPDGVSQGVDVTVTPNGISSYSVEVYEGANNGMLLGSDCGAGEVIKIDCAEQLTPPLFIKVTSTDAGCGDFTVLAEDVDPPCTYADDCIEATPEALVTNTDGVISYDVCVKSCLDYACPETNPGSCGTNNGPTVWFQFQIDDDAAQFYAQVLVDDGSWDPSFEIYAGPDCNNLISVNGCNALPDVHQGAVNDYTVGAGGNGFVWVAVTAVDPSTIIGGGFSICATTVVDIIACVGGNPPDYEPNCDPAATYEVIERSNDPTGALGLPLAGPYCPGETIRVCWDFFYDASITGQDWLHGIIPILGDGFDLDVFDPATVSHPGTGGAPVWFDDNTTRVQKTIPNTCVYTDAAGNMRVCNKFCQACPCATPMPAQTFLPGGWFWNTPGPAGGDCDGGTSLPETSYGIGQNVVNITDFCFDLTIKNFATEPECQAADFEVGFQTFSDAASGCWDDPLGECLNDVAQISNDLVTVACDFPGAVNPTPDMQEICSGDMISIFVETADGTTDDIVIVVEDNPDVTGETLPTITFAGAGTINDVLTINPGVTTPQVVTYTARVVIPGVDCPGPDTVITITIYPDILIDFNPNPVVICPGADTQLNPIITGGNGNYVTYSWSPTTSLDDPTSPTPIATPTTQTTYTVQVTDDLGCTGTGSVVVDVAPPVDVDIFPEEYSVCQVLDGFNTDINIVAEMLDGTPPYSFNWIIPAGIVGTVGLVPGTHLDDTYTVDEELSTGSAGVPYIITVEVTDANGCFDQATAFVTIADAPRANIDAPSLNCGDTQVTIEGDGFPTNGGAAVVLVRLYTCDGILITEVIGDLLSEVVDLINYPNGCFYIEVEDEDGCTSRTADLIIPITQATPIVLTTDSVACADDMLTVAVVNTGDYATYEWDPNGEVTPSITTVIGQTVYTVTATDNTGCSSVAQRVITYNPLPDVQISGSSTFCLGDSTTLSADGGLPTDTYQWFGPVTGSNPTLTTATAGTYVVSLVDGNGCSDTDTIMVMQSDTLQPSISGGPICDGSQVILRTGSFDSYEWFGPDGLPMGVTVDSIVVDSAGVFRVAVMQGGCSGSGTFEVIENAAPMVDVTDTVYVCAVAGQNQSIDFTAQAVGDLGEWSFVGAVGGPDLSDVTNVDFTGLAVGTYTFAYADTVAMAPCPTASDTMAVLVVRPSAATLVPDPICNDRGTLVLSTLENTTNPGTWTVTNGPVGHTLDVSTGTIDATDQPAGLYELTFTVDPLPGVPGCQPSSTQTLEILDAPTITLTGEPNQVCNVAVGGNETTFDLDVLIVASDQGTWTQTGGPTVTLVGGICDGAGLPVGTILTFVYTIENVEPCRDIEQEVTVEVINCNCPPALLSALPDLCTDNLPIDLDTFLTSDRPGVWSTNATPDPLMGSTFDPSGLPSGSYQVYYVFNTMIQECPDSLVRPLIVRAAPQITFESIVPPCNENTGVGETTVNLTDLVTGNGTSQGNWTQIDNGNAMLAIAADGTVDFAGQTPGDDFVFVYTTTSEGAMSPCSNISDTLTITVIDCECLNPDIDGDLVCNDQGDYDLSILTTTTTDAGTFTVISPGATVVPQSGTTINLTGLDGGDYTVIYTLDVAQSGACPQADTVILEVSAVRSATVTATGDACTIVDGPIPAVFNLTGLVTDGDATGIWLDANGTPVPNASLVSFLGEPSGQTYDFTYRLPGVAPCGSVSYPVVITTLDCDCPVPQVGPLADVCADAGTYNLTVFDDPDEPGTWTSDALTLSAGVIDLTAVTGGDYEVYYNLDNPEPDCPPADTLILTVVDPPSAGTLVPVPPICQGVPVIVTLNDALDGETSGGVWTEVSATLSTGGAFDALAGTFTVDAQAAGTYRFAYQVAGTAPCQPASETIEVVIEPLPVADAGADEELTCDNNVANLGGNSSTGANITYQWLSLGQEVGTESTLNTSQAGDYRLVVTDTQTGCTAVDVVSVTSDGDLPQIFVTPQPISCFGAADGGIAIITEGGTPPYTYSIDGGITTSTSVTLFTNLVPGDYNVVVTDAQMCTVSELVTLLPKQQATIDLGPDIALDDGADTTLTFTTSVPDSLIANIIWTQDDVVICEGAEDCQQITVTGDFAAAEFCVTVVDTDMCEADDCLRIVTETVINLNIPSIFNPTSSTQNDRFFVKSSSVARVNKMLIYNRWGELLFEVTDVPPNDPAVGWDGRYKGQAVNPGVFVYVIDLSYVNDARQPETITGDITIVR